MSEKASEIRQEQGGRINGRFAPGVSGNPGGRPREVAHVRELARQWTEQAIQVLGEIMTNPREKASARVAAGQALLDRGWGRPESALQLQDANGQPLALRLDLLPTCERRERDKSPEE